MAEIQRSISGFESQLRVGTMRRTISGGQDTAKASAEALRKASARLRGTLEDPRGCGNQTSASADKVSHLPTKLPFNVFTKPASCSAMTCVAAELA